MAGDQYIVAVQSMCPGKRGDAAQQPVKRLAGVLARVIVGAEGSQQIADDIAKGIGNQRLARATGAAKPDADGRQLPIGSIFAHDFDLCRVIAFLLAIKGAAMIHFAGIPQLTGTDGRPSGLLNGLASQFFRVRVPRDARHHALRVHPAQHGRDQRQR